MAQELSELNYVHPRPSSKEGVHNMAPDPPLSLSYLPQPVPATILHDLPFRRKSKSHARKQNPGHVPRPRNAFILFRCHFVKQRVPDDVISDHRDVSRLAGCMWRKMSDEQKRPWFEKAEIEKLYHSQMFPTYRFAPERGSQPKRMYQRKKPPVSEEVLLLDPRVVEPRAISPPPGCSAVQGRSPSQRGSNVYPTRPNPQEATQAEVLKHRHTDEQLRHSSTLDETIRSPFILAHKGSRPPSPAGQFHGGFVQLPSEQEELPNLESPPMDYDHDAYWLTGTSSTHDPDPYSVSYSPIPTSAESTSTGHSNGSLYGMWQDLELFHEQPLHSPNHPGLTSGHQSPYDDFSNYAVSPAQEVSYTPSPASSADEVYDPSGYLVVDAHTDRIQSPLHSP